MDHIGEMQQIDCALAFLLENVPANILKHVKNGIRSKTI